MADRMCGFDPRLFSLKELERTNNHLNKRASGFLEYLLVLMRGYLACFWKIKIFERCSQTKIGPKTGFKNA